MHTPSNRPLEKIAFICGTASLGKDGVGDYCRNFQPHLQSLGIESKIIAIRDKTIPKGQTIQEDELVTQISVHASPSSRKEILRKTLSDFSPDWLSYQFVPYSYHPKGIIRTEIPFLSQIPTPESRIHFMMHELWIGLSQSESLKRKLIGVFQKRYIRKLLKQLAPPIIHTSNAGYSTSLKSISWDSKILPIPSNIPVVPHAPLDSWAPQLEALESSEANIKAILFGTTHPQWDPRISLDWLNKLCESEKREATIIAIGRNGPAIEKLREVLAHETSISLIELGEQSPHTISQTLSFADIGLTSMPIALLEKSGTYSAMVAHGLHVYASRDDWQLNSHSPSSTPDNVTLLSSSTEPKRATPSPNSENRNSLEAIVGQFVSDLNLASSQ